jgi:hypothetical protein
MKDRTHQAKVTYKREKVKEGVKLNMVDVLPI